MISKETDSQTIAFFESKVQALEKQNEILRNARAILLEQNKTLKKSHCQAI